jgi:hypothetical protein
MGSPVKDDLSLLYDYSLGSRFIIETGGGGESTKHLSKAARESGAKFICIEADRKKRQEIEGVENMTGWSIRYEDIIKPSDPRFLVSRYKNLLDGKIAQCKSKWLAKFLMRGPKDLIRKALEKYSDLELDFFFCDTGEYCGIAEWNIVKDVIKTGGYFAAHDIYYPKSIKCFQVVKEIEESDNWEVKEKTESSQGLLIAKKIK